MSASVPDEECARVPRLSKRVVKKMKACIALIAIDNKLTIRVKCGADMEGYT